MTIAGLMGTMAAQASTRPAAASAPTTPPANLLMVGSALIAIGIVMKKAQRKA